MFSEYDPSHRPNWFGSRFLETTAESSTQQVVIYLYSGVQSHDWVLGGIEQMRAVDNLQPRVDLHAISVRFGVAPPNVSTLREHGKHASRLL